MENFIVSARKYRPSTFNSVVGQQSITVTLKNSIKKNHLAHAYLFCGPRGVGKTTCARIFAKTINCKNRSDDFESCNKCESCKAFNESRSYNIHELDAASNNSVEDIRNLIEQVRIPPQIGSHSVYIIDEVHMLSAQAFNAFLKTLEEPPSHAVFVLATTEKHKILPTILSRCQIFDFNRIKIEDTVNHLAYVAQSENVIVERDALNIIAQKADGAMRDALSFFDQIVSFSGNKITYNDTIENLNVLDYDYYFKITDYFYENNFADTLLTFNEILNKGFDGHHFITGLSGHFRDLLVCKNIKTIELLEVGASIKERYKAQSQKIDTIFLLKALKINNEADLSYKASKNKRLQVELALLKLNYITNQVVPERKNEKIIKQTTQTKQNTNEIKETKKIVTSRVKTSGISIKRTPENKKQKIPEKIAVEKKIDVIEKKNFTQEEINLAWNKLTYGLKSKPRLYSILKNSSPTLTSSGNIEIKVSSKLVQDKLNEIKSKLVLFLRKKLNNNNINLIVSLSEKEIINKKKNYIPTETNINT